ncbi:MAG: FtsW/RodA/SpoVE family cell cycle protein [Bacteroidia bacterium]
MKEIWLKIKPKGDPVMWMIIIFLMIIGLLAVYSTTSGLVNYAGKGSTEMYLLQQVVLLSVGFLIMLVIHTIPYKTFLKLAKIVLYISYILLVLTITNGKEINGAKRWLEIPFTPITIQTSELAKIALFVYITRYLAIKQDEIKDLKKTIIPLTIHIALICALIAPNNLSTAVVIFTSSMVILFIGRAKISHIIYVTLMMVFIGVIMLLANQVMPENYKFLGRNTTWQSRLKNFDNPFGSNRDKEKNKTLEQKDYAQIAVATGGILGKGPGQSTIKNLFSQAYNDFIYAIINEEYGLWGALIILLLFMIFMFRAFRIIIKSPKASGALLAIGLSFSFCLQALIHMGVSTTLLPVTGLTLPFISKGGTSVIITCIAFGMIMSVSRFVEEEQTKEVEA